MRNFVSITLLTTLLLLYFCHCANIDEQNERSLSPLLPHSSPLKSDHLSFPKELIRDKRKTKIKIKDKGHKTKIKIKTGGGGYRPRGGGMLLGAGLLGGGLIGGGLIGASLVGGRNYHFHRNRYGDYEYNRHGHALFVASHMNISGFNYSDEHQHYHDEHGDFLAPDGLYYRHITMDLAHDARLHVPIESVARALSTSSFMSGNTGQKYFRYYPYNKTHGLWEYNSISIVEVVSPDSSLCAMSSNLLLFTSLLLSLIYLCVH